MNEPREPYHTVPWLDEDFVVFDGFRVVYSTDDNGVITQLHLPGGRTIDICEAIVRHEVKLPRFRRPSAYGVDHGIAPPAAPFRNQAAGWMAGIKRKLEAAWQA